MERNHCTVKCTQKVLETTFLTIWAFQDDKTVYFLFPQNKFKHDFMKVRCYFVLQKRSSFLGIWHTRILRFTIFLSFWQCFSSKIRPKNCFFNLIWVGGSIYPGHVDNTSCKISIRVFPLQSKSWIMQDVSWSKVARAVRISLHNWWLEYLVVLITRSISSISFLSRQGLLPKCWYICTCLTPYVC